MFVIDGFRPKILKYFIWSGEEFIRFEWPWPNFQGHQVVNVVKSSLYVSSIIMRVLTVNTSPEQRNKV